MLRSVAAILAGVLAVTWAGLPKDLSYRETMVPVRMAADAAKTLLVAPREVTVSEWNRCVRDGGCSPLPQTSAGNLPVAGVNWFDVNEYLAWARKHVDPGLRLPTRAEWRWLYRDLQKPEPAPIFTDPRLAWAANYGNEESAEGPVRAGGSYSTTADGISDLDSNVWEWTSTCAKSSANESNCPAYVAEGLHEAAISVFIRNPAAGGCATGTPPTYVGFRLVADLN